MYLHIFKGIDKQGNALHNYSKFCTRPKATNIYKHLMNLLDKDQIHGVHVERTETYCSF